MSIWLFLIACHGVGIAGGLATAAGLREWYPTLRKPPFNPPGWVFGPVWTLLYTLIAVAGWRIQANNACLGWFCLQLLLNAVWSPIFFGLRRPGAALVNIALLWLTIVMCLIRFWAVDPQAGWLFVPYLLWVSFASLLNFELWRLNRRR